MAKPRGRPRTIDVPLTAALSMTGVPVAPEAPPVDTITEGPWWREFVDEQGNGLRHTIEAVVERNQRLNQPMPTYALDDPAMVPVWDRAKGMIEHFLAGKVLDGKLGAGDKGPHREQMMARMPAFIEHLLREIEAEWRQE